MGRNYVVRLGEMKQYNEKTGARSSFLARKDATELSSCWPTSGLRVGKARYVVRGDLPVQWEWQDDDGVSWVPYSEAVSLTLERASQCGDNVVYLGGKQGWEVDLVLMHQANTAFSGRKRNIKRVDLTASTGGAATTAGGLGMVRTGVSTQSIALDWRI